MREKKKPAKPLSEVAPAWAQGCFECRYGVVSAPPLSKQMPLYLERLAQLKLGRLVICECEAGKKYMVSLLNAERRLIEEARSDGKLQGPGGHVELTTAINYLRGFL